jgi:hypothetical protein
MDDDAALQWLGPEQYIWQCRMEWILHPIKFYNTFVQVTQSWWYSVCRCYEPIRFETRFRSRPTSKRSGTEPQGPARKSGVYASY